MLDVVYCAWNRFEFTRFTFECLLKNTNWSVVRQLVVYDDRSTDGTAEYLREAAAGAPVPVDLRMTGHSGTSVGALAGYANRTDADLFAFVENDLAVCPHWLDDLIGVMQRSPTLELLGMEPNFCQPPGPDWEGEFTYFPFTHIGGSGLMRTHAFRSRPAINLGHGLAGFEIWQQKYALMLGWIAPDLRCCLLDRHPFDPWRSLSLEYEAKGWQRPWHLIPEAKTYYWDWFPKETVT